MGEKSLDNLLSGIAGSKERPLWRLLFGLGILHVGTTAARKLADRFRTVDALRAASGEELQATEDIGEVMARSIRQWFENPKVAELLASLKEAGLNFGENDKHGGTGEGRS